ncbi:MAG TPA: AMP-binding protein [Nocardioidaceae bacterium]|nr:AMP-binding protein [Nocardioidaceae bacterium]
MADPATLRPVSGAPQQIELELRRWLEAPAPGPLSVRTSGSTGEPKDVLLARAALVASAQATLDRLGGPGQWVLALPPNYVAGLQVIVRSLLAGTSPVVLRDQPDLPTATAALSHGRRYLAIVPTQLHRWLAEPASASALSTYDAVLVGGAATAPDLHERAREGGVAVVVTYGMSETCGGCVYDGFPLDGVAVKLAADGRIRIGGPTLFDGYADRPDLTAEVLQDGWFQTADLGRLDPDGRLEVLGRADDVAVSGGVNVPLGAVQRRLASMLGVGACEVLAVPDQEWGEAVVAVVPTSSVAGAGPDLDEIRDFVSERLPRAWAPRRLILVESLPMLASGKVDRAGLRAMVTAAVSPAEPGVSVGPSPAARGVQ